MAQYKIQQLEVAHMDGEDGLDRTVFSMTLLQGEGHCILVDAGIDLTQPKSQHLLSPQRKPCCHAPAAVLGQVGVTPEEVDAIFLTHLHWDHTSGFSLYPNATIYLQKEELFHWIELFASDATRDFAHRTVSTDIISQLLTLLYQGRVVLLEGPCSNLFPGISVEVSTMGHSFAMSLILVDNATTNGQETFAIVGDLCTGPTNLLGEHNDGIFVPHTKFSVGSVVHILEDYQRLMGWVKGDVSRVVMTHDTTWQNTPVSRTTPLGLHIRTVCP